MPAESTRALGNILRDVMKANADANKRMLSLISRQVPEAIGSNDGRKDVDDLAVRPDRDPFGLLADFHRRDDIS